mmetsp:Transcript_6332/g.18990  ORF Transcript_6332/g.18990 Transcript_6332/m.18990 type:complete len:223 (-) Transcript_6332:1319-1987(-)
MTTFSLCSSCAATLQWPRFSRWARAGPCAWKWCARCSRLNTRSRHAPRRSACLTSWRCWLRSAQTCRMVTRKTSRRSRASWRACCCRCGRRTPTSARRCSRWRACGWRRAARRARAIPSQRSPSRRCGCCVRWCTTPRHARRALPSRSPRRRCSASCTARSRCCTRRAARRWRPFRCASSCRPPPPPTRRSLRPSNTSSTRRLLSCTRRSSPTARRSRRHCM